VVRVGGGLFVGDGCCEVGVFFLFSWTVARSEAWRLCNANLGDGPQNGYACNRDGDDDPKVMRMRTMVYSTQWQASQSRGGVN
jgi:hypothetical protein